MSHLKMKTALFFLLVCVFFLLNSQAEARSGKGLKGRNRVGGKNRELLRNPKSTDDDNTPEKTVHIRKVQVKQKNGKRQKVKTKIQSYKKRTSKKHWRVKNKKNIAPVGPKSSQQPQKGKVKAFFQTIPENVKSLIGKVKQDLHCRKVNQECTKPDECCLKMWCNLVKMSDPTSKSGKTKKGICENCLPYNANCKYDVMCCSRKCEDRGGFKQCGPTVNDRKKIIKAEKKVNKLLVNELKRKVLSGQSPF